MTEPGKNAPGLKGFPTPNEAAETASYLLLYFQDKEWAQYALGALKALTVGYNWYKSGDLDVDEAAEAFRLIVQDAPYNHLPSCSLPSGEPLMRIDPETGHIQNIDDAGNWQDDPSIPPTPSRPHATPEEMRCLAAANAANALKILYENLTDSFTGGLTAAAAAVNLVAGIGEAIALEFFPPAAALIAIGQLLFDVVYATVEFVTADVWDEAFTGHLQCYLFECSSVRDADVVTFDWHCVINSLAAQTDAFDLTATQIRLFGQLYYLLSYIGSDGLNYAGSATAIETADCSECGGVWCYNFQDASRLGDWIAEPFVPGAEPTYHDGAWYSTLSGSTACLFISWIFMSSVTLTDAGLIAVDDGLNRDIWVNGDGSPFSGTLIWRNGAIVGTPFPIAVDRIDVIEVQAFNPTTRILSEMQYSGTGENPFGDDNC